MSERDFRDETIGRSVLAALGVSQKYAKELAAGLGKIWRESGSDRSGFLTQAFRFAGVLTGQAASALGAVLRRVLNSSWLLGGAVTIARFPRWIANNLKGSFANDPPNVETVLEEFGGGGIEFPRIEDAAELISQMPLVGERDLDQVVREHDRQVRFTVDQLGTSATHRVREILSEVAGTSLSLKEFQTRVAEHVDTGPLGAGTLERVMRTNVQAKWYQASEEIIESDGVSNLFPYVIRIPIKDARLTSLCAQLATSGIESSGIYRRDDPVWRQTQVPSHWNCRCMTQFLTVGQAVRQGLRSAMEWRTSGSDPHDFVNFPKLTDDAFKLWESWSEWVPRVAA